MLMRTRNRLPCSAEMISFGDLETEFVALAQLTLNHFMKPFGKNLAAGGARQRRDHVFAALVAVRAAAMPMREPLEPIRHLVETIENAARKLPVEHQKIGDLPGRIAAAINMMIGPAARKRVKHAGPLIMIAMPADDLR